MDYMVCALAIILMIVAFMVRSVVARRVVTICALVGLVYCLHRLLLF